MEYSLIEKWTNENLMLKWYDFMFIGETKKETKAIFDNWQETQKEKIEKAWFNYWDTIHEYKTFTF